MTDLVARDIELVLLFKNYHSICHRLRSNKRCNNSETDDDELLFKRVPLVPNAVKNEK